MKRLFFIIASLLAVVSFSPEILRAEYTLVLKNGRRITVQEYREEGGVIKFYGLGGEIGIPKDQIQTILKAGAPESRGMVLPQREESQSGSSQADEEKAAASAAGESATKAGAGGGPKVQTPEEQQAAEKDKEEKEYQQKLKEVTDNLRATRDRYAIATRGSAGPEPSVPFTDEQIKARTDDLSSRAKDVQGSQAGFTYESAVESPKPAPLTGDPPPLLQPGAVVARPSVGSIPPAYTQQEQNLSDLRGQINQLETQRQRLIDEMKQKNFDTGNLFLE